MPHSVSSEDAKTQDTLIADAGTNNGETQTAEDRVAANSEANNADSQLSETIDQEMTMADAGVEGEVVPLPIKAEEKIDVKLEDLFADMESDEEFPSSNIQDTKASSPPEAPLSPV